MTLEPPAKRFRRLRAPVWRLRYPLLLASLVCLYLIGMGPPGTLDLIGLVLLAGSAALWHRTMYRPADAWLKKRGFERFKRIADSLVAVSTFAWLGVGLFVMIAPRFEATYDKAYIAAMKADLRNLTSAQEARLQEGRLYAGTLEQLGDFGSADGVTVVLESATSSGGVALASHDYSQTSCAVAWGDAVNPIDSAQPAGVPICRAKYRWRRVLR